MKFRFLIAVQIVLMSGVASAQEKIPVPSERNKLQNSIFQLLKDGDLQPAAGVKKTHIKADRVEKWDKNDLSGKTLA